MKRLIAIGDIHGCFDALQRLIEEEIRIQKSDRIVFLGDYIDRGRKSKEVIDYILSMKTQGFDLVTLRGNHEQMLIDAFREDAKIMQWLFNGGGETLKSFDLEATIGLPDKYWQFFYDLPYCYSCEDYIFVHAGFNDKAEHPFEDKYQMVWTRNDDYTHSVLLGKTIIHGHTPISLETCKYYIEQQSSVLNIDTGCVFKDIPGCGKLTALDVLSGSVYSV